jgi:ribonuclease BN (tRNA processing enzyme)
MRLTFLGSGDAFGSGGRRVAHGNVLVDCGASSMVAIRKWQVDPNAISTVLVSHLHGDPFGGLPFFLLDAQLISRRTAPLTLAGPPGFRERLMIVMEAMFAGSTRVEPSARWRSASSSCTSEWS